MRSNLAVLRSLPAMQQPNEESSLIDSLTVWWQTILQSIFSLIFSNSVYFEATGTTVHYQDGNVGEGAYSVVLKASKAFEGVPKYALKRMLLQSSEIEAIVDNEISAFHKFKHSNIIPLLDSTKVVESGQNAAYLLFPLMSRGSLRDVVSARGQQNERELAATLQSFRAICCAVNVLHVFQPSYVHQDIKLENVLVGAEGEPYLIDLGSVREANVKIETRRDELRVAEQAAQHCTASYRAPELYDPPRGVTLDARTDVWSLGCLLFAMWFGYSPFECEFSGDALRVVECSSLRVLSAVPRPASPSRADRAVLGLAGWILEKDLGRRPYTSDVITRIDEALRGLRDGDNVV